jgi:hypothetical protein
MLLSGLLSLSFLVVGVVVLSAPGPVPVSTGLV